MGEGTVVTLNGSESYDPDDGIASHEWHQTGGVSIILSNSTAAQPTFTTPSVGVNGDTLIFVLEVMDWSGITGTDEVSVNVTNENQPPVADAGPDQEAQKGDTVTLDGSVSSDTDGVLTSYLWNQTSGALVTLSDVTSDLPMFVVPDIGVNDIPLIFELTVTDDDGLKNTDSITVNIMISENQAPAADAGNPQTVKEGTTVMLDASNSHDSDGVLVSYFWNQAKGPLVMLSDATSVQPTFLAPDVGADMTLLFDLTVTDDDGMKSTDSVTVTVIPDGNMPPVADAGDSQTVEEGATVMLDGSESSDPDGTIASYFWKQTQGTSVTLSDAATGQPTFLAPDAEADVTLMFEMAVTDDRGLKSTDTVTVTVISRENQPPLADAGYSQTVEEGATVMLDGSESRDPDGTIASYFWKQTQGTSVTLSDAASGQPTFLAPDAEADVTLMFEMAVTDDRGLKSTDTVTVTVISRENQPPLADAGDSQTVEEGATVMLDGSESSDPDGTIASYFWKQTQGTSVTLSDAASGQPTFLAPDAEADVTLMFEMAVTDDRGLKSTDTVTVTVISRENQPPLADAGDSQTVEEGSTVMLDGSESRDPDGTIASYFWKQISGTSVTLSNAESGQPTFLAPDAETDVTLIFELTVTDNDGLKSTDNIAVYIKSGTQQGAPVADAGYPPPQTIEQGTVVTLDGSNSWDTSDGGSIVSYFWTQTEGPAVTLSEPESARPTFVAPLTDTRLVMKFQLTVTDNDGLQNADEVTITISDKSPSASADDSEGGGDSSGCFIETANDNSVKKKNHLVSHLRPCFCFLLSLVCAQLFF